VLLLHWRRLFQDWSCCKACHLHTSRWLAGWLAADWGGPSAIGLLLVCVLAAQPTA
jgi:hypothetical protein